MTDPNPADQRNAAREFLRQGRPTEALAAAHAAWNADPQNAESRLVLAGALRANGQFDKASVFVEGALATRPDYPQAYATRAQLRMAADPVGALADVERALSLDPDLTPVWPIAAVLRARAGDLPGAAVAMEMACAQAPGNVAYLIDLGERRRQADDVEGAIEALTRATTAAPGRADGWFNLSLAQLQNKCFEAAATSVRRAIELDPNTWEAHHTLGMVLGELDRVEEARIAFFRALELHPTLPSAINAHLVLPAISSGGEAMAKDRARFQAGIAALETYAFEPDSGGVHTPSFNLAYQGLDDRPLMEAVARTFRKLSPELTWAAPHITSWRPPASSQPIRVGVLSEFLSGHTVGNLYGGLIRNLNRARFEVVAIHTPKSKRDAFRDELSALCRKAIVLPRSLEAQRSAIAEERLDVLFYPDIGMAHVPFVLAFSRLAPIQAVSLGHPVTTGIDTMDYFLSSTAIEPPGAEAHYSETLVQFRRLPFFYNQPGPKAQDASRLALGLPATGTLYGCPQSLFKFHPDFDPVLAEIATGDPTGAIVLVAGSAPEWTNLLKARWAHTYPVLLERVRFVPRMNQAAFLALLDHIDVLLDPLHFGSGNTLYEAMSSGVPVVTTPGAFARGRAVSGAYRQMGIADAPIAERVEDYAPLALALGRDPARRAALRTVLAAAAARELYSDLAPVREFEAFLEAAVAAAGTGSKLASTWRTNVTREKAGA